MTTYRITPVKHYLDVWVWWAARDFDWGGQTPTFKIGTADHYSLVAGERLAVWGTAADSDNWNDFGTVTIGTPDITFVHGSAFPAGMIYIAALPMYPFSRVQRKMGEWGASAWVSETASTTNFVIGNESEHATIDGRTAPALPYYGFKITGDRVGDKNKAILSGGNHPAETPGRFVFEAAVDYLLGETADAETLRDYFEFYIYPCLNTQGIWSGYNYTHPQDITKSINQYWNTTGTLDCIDAFKTAMAADTGGTINVGFDYHSWMSNTDVLGDVQTGNTGGNYEYYRVEMAALDAGFNLLEENLPTSVHYWFGNTLGASLAMAIEQGCTTARGVPEYKTYGENTMKALYELLIDGRFTYGP